MVEMAMASITIFSFLFGIVGFVFKIWIINPLSTAIENLQKTVDALAKTINREQERTTDLKIKLNLLRLIRGQNLHITELTKLVNGYCW